MLAIDLLTATLFAVSLHFIMGPAGMHSFGHAAYFGLGAYGAALLVRSARPADGGVARCSRRSSPSIGALVFGWFSVRLSGVYLAMLTLAFAQIVWSVVFQWDDVTGGSNGLTGVWPAAWLSDRRAYFYLTLGLVVASVAMLRRVVFSPFGYAMRASRDSPLRAEAIGIDVKRVQWMAFVVAGAVRGPRRRAVRVLEGQHLAGHDLGRALRRRARDGAARRPADARRARSSAPCRSRGCRTPSRATPTTGARCSAASSCVLVLAFPRGIAGFVASLIERVAPRREPALDAALDEPT